VGLRRPSYWSSMFRPDIESSVHLKAPVLSRMLYVPLWLPLIVLAIPTAILWWLDRRRRLPGHCRRCGYNLTGNVSGRCPECGTRLTECTPKRRGS
jgi:hypothetical protein